MNTQLAICVTFAIVCFIGLFTFFAFGAARNKKKEELKNDEAWKEYLRFKASRSELTDENGNRIPPEQVV